MKVRLLIVCLLMTFLVSGRAEDSIPGDSMDSVFRQMPDSLIPTLSENNRLDMIDFVISNMKAEVTNLFGGKSEMLALTHDSLCIRVSDGLTVRMLLLKPIETMDSCSHVVCMAQTFGSDSLSLSTRMDYFTSRWQRLDLVPRFSEADEQRKEGLNVQTILKWEGEILKKIKFSD
jgi:hypothetical protein